MTQAASVPFDLFGSEFFGLGFLLAFLVAMLVFRLFGHRRNGLPVRELPAFVHLGHVIGLAVEAGRRLHVSMGSSGLSGVEGMSSLVGLSILHRIVHAAYTSDRPPVATSGESSIAILSQDAFQRAAAGDKESSLDYVHGQLSGLTPFSYAAGVLPVIFDQQVSATLLMGHFGNEIGLIADASERNGGLTLAGSDSISAQAVAYATAQQPLIGEELYASGAYLASGSSVNTREMHCASLYAQDLFRWVVIFVILVGLIMKLLGVL